MPTKTSPNKQVLHVGCGEKRKDSMPNIFQSEEWAEIRLDIDPDVKPDVVASMLEMTDVKTDTMDALWSSHNIEHLYWHDVPTAFAEFFRVIKPGGFVYITC
ncbi:MAG: methyltransferase domain-containing protein, partial [Sneathiella sp.]